MRVLQRAAGTYRDGQAITHRMISMTAVHAMYEITLPNFSVSFFAELAWSKGISFGWNNSVCNVSSPGLNEYGAASLALHNYSSRLTCFSLSAPWARECGMFGFVLSCRLMLADCSQQQNQAPHLCNSLPTVCSFYCKPCKYVHGTFDLQIK